MNKVDDFIGLNDEQVKTLIRDFKTAATTHVSPIILYKQKLFLEQLMNSLLLKESQL